MTGRDQNPLGLPNTYVPPPVPASMPTMVFMHGGNDTYHQLRGRPIFEAMRAGGYKVALPETGGGIRIPGASRLMVLMDIQVEAADWVEEIRDRSGSVVLVDVTWPVWNPAQIVELEPGGREYWSNPENQRAAHRILLAADGLTTPHPAYADPLLDFNEQVFVLPDLDEDREESWADFTVRLSAAWHTSSEAKAERLRAAAVSA